MVGLSVVLEKNKKSVVCGNIMSMNQVFSFSSSSSSMDQLNYPASTFLQHCYLCKQKLFPGKDIYMYKGDKGFCSEECRYRQIFMDDQEENLKKENCCLAFMKVKISTSSSASSSSYHRRAY